MAMMMCHSNMLLGPLPDAVSSMETLGVHLLENNRLRGLIPRALLHHESLSMLSLSSNDLSGTVATVESQLQLLLLGENKLTGSVPAFRDAGGLTILTCSGNMLEGTVPADVMLASSLLFLDLSGKVGQSQGFRGWLPSSASQASALKHFMISHQNLEGCIPPLTSTLWTLALHCNRFSLFDSACWHNDSVILMHTNLLSCAPPACGGSGTHLSERTLSNFYPLRPEGQNARGRTGLKGPEVSATRGFLDAPSWGPLRGPEALDRV